MSNNVIASMQKRKPYKVSYDPFQRIDHVDILGTTLKPGDIFKIKGRGKLRFKFHEYVINPENGKEWVSCFKIDKGIVEGYYSCRKESVQIIKTRRPRVKRTRRNKSS